MLSRKLKSLVSAATLPLPHSKAGPPMSIEDTIGYQNHVPACAVCGKNVQHGGGFARVKQGETMVELCCPLCLDLFQKDPQPYLKRLLRVEYFRELSNLRRSTAESTIGNNK